MSKILFFIIHNYEFYECYIFPVKHSFMHNKSYLFHMQIVIPRMILYLNGIFPKSTLEVKRWLNFITKAQSCLRMREHFLQVSKTA